MNYSKLDASLQLTSPGTHLDGVQRTGLIAVGVGLVAVFSAFMGQLGSLIPFWIGVGGVVVGTILYSWRTYMSRPAGVRNDGTVHSSVIGRGAVGWMLGVALTGFLRPSLLGPRIDDSSRIGHRLAKSMDTREAVGPLVRLRALLHACSGRDGNPRSGSLPSFAVSDHPYAVRRLFSDGLRLHHPGAAAAFQSARVLFPLLLALEVRLPLSRHSRISRRGPGRARRIHGLLGRNDDRYCNTDIDLLFREAVVLLVGMRMRSAGQYGR